MQKRVVKLFMLMSAVLFMSITVMELNAEARGGGGRSFGSRGTRSYSRPATPSAMQKQPRQQTAPGGIQQQAGGSFMRSMAGGMMGGMIGSMLFRGSAEAGAGDGTGGGVGMFEIILLAGGGLLLYRFINRRKENQ